VIDAMAIGIVAGLLTGLFSVGAGALIVPALVVLVGLSQVDAEATSLLALVPVAVVGAWRQDRYGDVRRRDAAMIGGLSAGGALAGVALAHVIPTQLLEIGFSAVLALVAVQLARRALRTGRPRPEALRTSGE
jgi:uncharacterized membrane protein YfcA